MSAQHTQLVMTEAFQRGLSWGMQGIFRGKLYVEQSEEGVVEIRGSCVSAFFDTSIPYSN